MTRLATLYIAACLGAFAAPDASAHEAMAAKNVHLRAGPARDYPVVAILPKGARLDVQGCLPDYSWCDAVGSGQRGWVYAANIDSLYQGVTVPVIDHGAALGLLVFGFVLGEYWSEHYRDRPWYRERDSWSHRPRPPQPPVPPRPQPPPRPRPPGAGPQPHPPSPPVHPAPPPQTRPVPPPQTRPVPPPQTRPVPPPQTRPVPPPRQPGPPHTPPPRERPPGSQQPGGR